jgi:hypothetical protein
MADVTERFAHCLKADTRSGAGWGAEEHPTLRLAEKEFETTSPITSLT